MSMIEISDAERRLADRLAPDAGNALAISPNAGGISFTNATQAMDFAKMMALSNSGVRKHLRGNPGACLAIVVQAVEWGVSPYAVANKSYFVNDQIAFESQLVQAVILRRAPIRGRIKFEFEGAGQTRRCRAWARLREDDEVVEYLSPEFKDIGTKNSPLWKADPDQQFAYYAGRALCRRHFPDVLLGIYTEDDFAEVTKPGPGTSRDVTPAPRSLKGKLDALAAPDLIPIIEAPSDEVVPVDEVNVPAGSGEADPAPVAPDPAPADPSAAVFDEMHALIADGATYLAARNKLPSEKTALLTKEQIDKLKKHESNIKNGDGQ